jgi:hypothetical protein
MTYSRAGLSTADIGPSDTDPNGAPDWIVFEIKLATDGREAYPLHVRGINLSNEDRPFAWQVRDIKDPRYDLSNATIEPAAIPYLGKAKS